MSRLVAHRFRVGDDSAMRIRAKLQVLTVLAVVLVGAGCAPAEEEPAATDRGADNCTKDALKTLTAGTLTFGTDQPAYPPWFVDDDPANGEGFEAAVAYAVAGKLGYDKSEVTWVRVPFNAAIAPGPKTFDANLSEFSITDERKRAVDFSSPYYDVTQAVVTTGSSPAAAATTLDALRALRLGAQVGTTSYTAAEALAPTQPLAVYNNNDDAKAALLSGQIDALVLDLPTAFAVQAELDDGTIVGQLPATTDKPEQFGIVLDQGSSLTSCVTSAVDELRADGTLADLQQQWLDEAGSAPVLK
jgi:polar amino acid transport system substrate-binding protein